MTSRLLMHTLVPVRGLGRAVGGADAGGVMTLVHALTWRYLIGDDPRNAPL